MSVDYMKLKPGAVCACGKEHCLDLKDVVIGKGAIRQLPACLEKLGAKKPFLLMDVNTQKAAGEKVAAFLSEAGVAYGQYVFQKEALKPDEWAVGSAVMHFDHSCDCIVTVGSGVLNDIGKTLHHRGNRSVYGWLCLCQFFYGYGRAEDLPFQPLPGYHYRRYRYSEKCPHADAPIRPGRYDGKIRQHLRMADQPSDQR